MLGKREFKLLLKWRLQALKELDGDENPGQEGDASSATSTMPLKVIKAVRDETERMEQELLSLSRQSKATLRRAKKKDRLAKEKSLSRMRLGMENASGHGATDNDLFSIQSSRHDAGLEAIANEHNGIQSEDDGPMEGDDTDYDSYLEKTLDRMYEEYRKRRLGIKPALQDLVRENPCFPTELALSKESDASSTFPSNKKTTLWFDRPEFEALNFDRDDLDENSEPPMFEEGCSETDNWSLPENGSDEPSWPLPSEPFDANSKYAQEERLKLISPEEFALAEAMKINGSMDEILDAAYNRYATGGDEDLPDWFLDEEKPHRIPILPITKEEVDRHRIKLKELHLRPTKKVMEARARKKMKLLNRQRRMKQQSETILNSEDLTEKQKATQINKLRSKVVRSKKEVTYVVAKGGNRGKKGRPKGVKGHYKMVDARLKKDVRAQKRKNAR